MHQKLQILQVEEKYEHSHEHGSTNYLKEIKSIHMLVTWRKELTFNKKLIFRRIFQL